MTPSLARVYKPQDMPSLKTILLGGEPMSQSDVQNWAGKKGIRLVNGYGPSECLVCCILADVNPNSEPSVIGHAYRIIAWIVDKDGHNRLMPPDAVSELLLEGHTLARGYLDEPEKTAAAFIDFPPAWIRELTGRSTSRLYKTGDLVQYAANGSGRIRYIGRKDTQIKIRGQRVELGEIEQQIQKASSSALSDIVVEVMNGLTLVAFICGSTSKWKCSLKETRAELSMFTPAISESFAEAQELVQTITKRLPSYMIPSHFIPISHVPISPSGKTDRRLLRERASLVSKKELDTYISSTHYNTNAQRQNQ
ncbi:uncharacterized protein BDV14DRAFT_200370 [Aspergillus stella-maris]|uniref:uncharacterized protein n=1 Tax=Aspergillus stella-maris TaxID=1810926 RepID=UPI003CCD3599